MRLFSIKTVIKIKTALVVALICAILSPSFSDIVDGRVQIANAADEGIAIDVLGTATDLISGNFFQFDDNIGQNLYTTIYQRVKSEGSNAAITKTTSRRKLSKAELYTIIPGSNITGIMAQPDPRAPLRDDQIRSRRDDLIRDLADEKDLGDFESLNKMQVESTELFANGDESDSGFDLLVDLDVMQAILFNKDIQSMSGQGGGGGHSGGANPQDQAQNNANSPAQNNADNNNSSAPKTPGAQAPVDASKIKCPTNTGLNDEIESERTKDRAAGAVQLDENGVNPDDAKKPIDDTPKPLVAAHADDWHRELPCSNVFCLKLELKYITESSFTVSDNCVMCHIQKINDSFKKLLNHNLVPNKVTGNLLEGPKCKDALYNSNWAIVNFIFIGQPILTPPNDDLIIKGDIWANMKLFWERYVDAPKKCDAGESCRISTAEQVLSQTKPNATFDQTTDSMAQEDRAIKDNKLKEYRADQLKRQVEAQGGQYRVIMQEMSTMNDYFNNYMKTFDDLTSDPAKSPCGVLANKQYCQ